MPELHSVFSPVFPVDKDVDVSCDAEPLAQTSSIQVFVQLAEPVVFIQGFESPHLTETPPSILRGSLIVRVLKPSKLKSISLSFKGFSRTEWPEGIPPKRQEFVEINDIVNHTWPFYQADSRIPNFQASSSVSMSTVNSGTSLEDDNGYLLHESGAAIYKPLPNSSTHRGRYSTTSLNALSSLSLASQNTKDGDTGSLSDANNADAGKGLSPMSILRRAASPGPKHDEHVHHRTYRSATTTSLISDLLSSTFSNTSDATNAIHNGSNNQNSNNNTGNNNSNNNNSSNGNISSHIGNSSGSGNEHFVFQPGEYIYTFEQAIPPSYPETIKADFGFVEYQLFVSIERFGAFKSNITTRFPVTLVRTQSDTSIEETEPIAISRDWEDQLHYDIVIASKDIILDAFLPIAFYFSPLDKVTLHRIRVYLTETMEYYCRSKKVHRMEPTKKFLLAEHNGPRVPGLGPESGPLKAKNMGNLLLDESSGDLVNKNYEYQIFVPSIVNHHMQLHPDTAFDKIKANHWIKLCLRLSRMIDGKRKHYEISIDSPIHVLHKLCSHANTLLPSYDTHVSTNEEALSACPKFGNTNDVNIYHNSNIFFPKEILLSPMLSPEVHPMDLNVGTHSRTLSPRPIRNRDRRDSKAEDPGILLSPRLRANIYQPEMLQRELTSPQAIPLSPIASPLMRPMFSLDSLDAPPVFDFDLNKLSNSTLTDELPLNPPSYNEVMKADGVEANNRSENTLRASLPRITLSKSEEKLVPAQKPTVKKARKSLESSSKEDDGDITSGFSFQGVSRISPNLPSAVLKSPSVNPLNLNVESKRDRQASITDILPSTVRNNNSSFNDMSTVLVGEGNIDSELYKMTTNASKTSSYNRSARSSISSGGFSNPVNMEPLLHHTETQRNVSADDLVFQSRDSINNYTEEPIDSSVDITALYDRNSNAWHPLQTDSAEALSPVASPGYSVNVANANHVMDDFKKALHLSNESSRVFHEDSVSTIKQNGDTCSSRNSEIVQESDDRYPRPASGEKQVIKETDREAAVHAINGGQG